MKGTLIGIEGITAANVGLHAERLVRHLNLQGHDAVLGPQQRADVTGPLAERTAALLTLVSEQITAGKTVVAAPYIGSAAAYRRAAGLFDIDDEYTEHTWTVLGLEPDLTLLLDNEPDPARPQDGPRQLAYHSAARDHLLRAAGWQRNTWRVLQSRIDQDLVSDEVYQHADWAIRNRELRWPLEEHWRRPRARLA